MFMSCYRRTDRKMECKGSRYLWPFHINCLFMLHCLLETHDYVCELNRTYSRAAPKSFFSPSSHLTAISVKGWHILSKGSWVEPIDEMKQVDFSLSLKWNEKQMSWRVTERVCVLSAWPMWVMALIWPPALWLFIILRWQGGAGKRRGLGAPSWSITP